MTEEASNVFYEKLYFISHYILDWKKNTHPFFLKVFSWISSKHFAIESERNNIGSSRATAIMLNHSHTLIDIPCPMNKCITATKTK